MRRIYLCGGINGLSDFECRDWRCHAKDLLSKYETLDPMRRDYRGKELTAFEEIVEGDVHDIDSSDAVLVNASRPSWGTAMEVRIAYELRKFIVAFGACDKLSPWLLYHCQIEPDIIAATNAIKCEFGDMR